MTNSTVFRENTISSFSMFYKGMFFSVREVTKNSGAIGYRFLIFFVSSRLRIPKLRIFPMVAAFIILLITFDMAKKNNKNKGVFSTVRDFFRRTVIFFQGA